jgi:hypothetical protein
MNGSALNKYMIAHMSLLQPGHLSSILHVLSFVRRRIRKRYPWNGQAGPVIHFNLPEHLRADSSWHPGHLDSIV